MTGTSLADMKAFPSAPEPIQGIPNLQLFHLCYCAQMHRSPASEAMNLLFCACPRNVYSFLTADPYPTNFAPFPPVIDKVPDYMGSVDDKDHSSKCTKHALNKKTRADIITMNAALTNVFLDALSSQVHALFQQRRLPELNILFVDIFEWFVGHCSKTMAKDRNANRQCMAADRHPINRFDTLALRLFTGAAYAGCTGRWLTATSSTLASASSSGAACMPRNTRHGLPPNPNAPVLPRRLTRSRRFGPQKSRLSTRRRYPLACTATAWPRSMTTTPLSHTASRSQTLAPRTPPRMSPSRPTAQQSR
jgi:hypothetical protein